MNSFLYAQPSFIVGLAAIMDFGNTLFEYNYSNDEDQADFIAIQSDWIIVGDDLVRAMSAYEQGLVGVAEEETTPAAQ